MDTYNNATEPVAALPVTSKPLRGFPTPYAIVKFHLPPPPTTIPIDTTVFSCRR